MRSIDHPYEEPSLMARRRYQISRAWQMLSTPSTWSRPALSSESLRRTSYVAKTHRLMRPKLVGTVIPNMEDALLFGHKLQIQFLTVRSVCSVIDSGSVLIHTRPNEDAFHRSPRILRRSPHPHFPSRQRTSLPDPESHTLRVILIITHKRHQQAYSPVARDGGISHTTRLNPCHPQNP